MSTFTGICTCSGISRSRSNINFDWAVAERQKAIMSTSDKKVFQVHLEIMLKPFWKAFRYRELPEMCKFGKMTWGSEIQKYKLLTSFSVWRCFVTSCFYLKYLNKQSNLFTCTTQEMKWYLHTFRKIRFYNWTNLDQGEITLKF